ncbi:MAG TPA: hypothetical protein VEP90_09940 [Methylomirabilota bacterium]|nr:hypothetical protein [Methylomirabilota bacterium]
MTKIISRKEWNDKKNHNYASIIGGVRHILDQDERGTCLTPVIIREDVEKVYNALNESEKYGICFGLFPARIQETMKQHFIHASDLMQYDAEVQKVKA